MKEISEKCSPINICTKAECFTEPIKSVQDLTGFTKSGLVIVVIVVIVERVYVNTKCQGSQNIGGVTTTDILHLVLTPAILVRRQVLDEVQHGLPALYHQRYHVFQFLSS